MYFNTLYELLFLLNLSCYFYRNLILVITVDYEIGNLEMLNLFFFLNI